MLIAQNKSQQSRQKERKGFFKKIAAGFGLASAILVGIGMVSYRSLTGLVETSNQAVHSHKVLAKLEKLLSQIKDAETGQRGYLITGQEPYLEPYYAAIEVIDQQVKDLRRLTTANPNQQRRLDTLEPLIAQRLAVSKQIVDVRKNEGLETAKQLVLTGRGKDLMDNIRQVIREMEKAENLLLNRASLLAEASARNIIITFCSGIFLTFFILAAVYCFIYREISERKRVEEQVNLLQTLMLAIAECGDFDEALTVILRTVCETKGWNYGEAWIPCPDESVLTCSSAWYSGGNDKGGRTFPLLEKFRRLSEEFTFPPGTGIPGRVWFLKQPEWQQDISLEPESLFGRANIARDCGLRAGLGIPLIVNEQVLAVLVFFKFESCKEDIRLVEGISAVAAQLGSVIQRKRTEEALRESQQMLQCVIDNIPQFIFWKDRNYVFLGCNSNFAQVAGIGSPKDIVGKTDYDLLWKKEESDFFRESDRRVMETDTPEYHIIEPLLRADGKQAWLGTNKVPLHDSEGNVVGILGTFADITERKQAQEQIKASLKEKEVLLKEIHHRVKNNLQIISSLLKLQSGYIKDAQAIEMFKESQSRIRAMALIHEKLYQANDLSRVNFAEYVSTLTANLFRSYELTLSAVKPIINVENVFLEIDVAVPCGLIINELISNSLKYAFPSGSEGEIRIELYSDNERFVLIVSDNGVGLPNNLDFLNSKTLGLQLINNLVEQLEGNVTINGDGGTEVRITFNG